MKIGSIKRQQLIDIGFKEMPHFTIMNSLTYDLCRHRQLSVGCIGEPNEMVFLCSMNKNNPKKIDDIICVHNWDYDGALTMEKLKALIFGITGRDC